MKPKTINLIKIFGSGAFLLERVILLRKKYSKIPEKFKMV